MVVKSHGSTALPSRRSEVYDMRVMMRHFRNRTTISLDCLAPEIVDGTSLSSFHVSMLECLARYSRVRFWRNQIRCPMKEEDSLE